MVPNVVVVAATLQLLLAATFLLIPVAVLRRGRDAQRAAEADVVRQGFDAGLLAQHRVRFEERAVELLFPVAIGLVLAALASLNLAGSDTGRVLSWLVQAVLLVGGGLVTAGQVFPVRFIEAAFRKSGDPTLRGVDVSAFVDAAKGAFPAWLRPMIVARFLLTTLGSLLVIVLLATPAADAYFG